MPYTPAGVISYGFPIDVMTFTYLLSGTYADDTAIATVSGKAMTQDATAANTYKVAGDGDIIEGRAFLAELRSSLGIKTVAVQRRFKEKLPATAGHGIVVGDRIVGAGNGLVKKDTTNTRGNPRVVEVGTDYVVAELL